MIRNEIAKGVYFTAVEGNYKKSRLSLALVSPLTRDNVTKTALLPYMLERGTASCPDMTLLKRRLNYLYGTNLNTSYMSYGFSRIVEGVMDGVDGSLLKDGNSVALERTKLLFDLLLKPHMENNAFCESWLDIEREKLRETINAVINDKSAYCFKLLNERFFEGDERSLPSDGYEQDLDNITAASLTKSYFDYLASAFAEIIYVGPDACGMQEIVAKAMQNNAFQPIGKKPITAVLKSTEHKIKMDMDVEQDKLGFAFTSGQVLSKKELAALRVGIALFGGTPTSRLFQNVREKQSLCYSISASPGYESGGGMYVECGIEHKNAALTRESIVNELAQFVKKGPNEMELEQVKLLFQNAFNGIYDNTSSIAKYAFTSIMRYNELSEPSEELNLLQQVSASDVKEVMAKLNCNCSCHISQKEVV